MAGCGDKASAAEERACDAASDLDAAEDHETLRRDMKVMVDASREADNGKLREAATAFRASIDKRDHQGAFEAIGRFREECDRLGAGDAA